MRGCNVRYSQSRMRRRGLWAGLRAASAPRYACPVAALSKAELAAMAGEATVDAYGDDEQAMRFHAMIVDNLKIPFVTGVLGVEVTVEHIGLGEDNSILAMCARGGIRQAVRVLDLPLPEPPPVGAQWIDAYRHWLG
jgi:hypothetical protein